MALVSKHSNRNDLSGASRMSSELVGVAGFEPAASSSRRQSDTPIASAGTACTCWSMSTGVRQRPSKTGWVVTQFVTQTDDDHVQRQAGDRLRVVSRCQLLTCSTIGSLAIKPVVGGGSNCRPSVFQV